MGVFISGSAFAGWGWNAKTEIGGVKVSTRWSVTADKHGASRYRTKIVLTVPPKVDASIYELSPEMETVEITRDNALRDRGHNLEARVGFTVAPNHHAAHSVGCHVEVAVVRLDGDDCQGEQVLASGSGPVGTEISLDVVIPRPQSSKTATIHSAAFGSRVRSEAIP